MHGLVLLDAAGEILRPLLGARPTEAAHIAVIVEEIAAMAFQTLAANLKTKPISKLLHDKHFLRKHGKAAYYGQER